MAKGGGQGGYTHGVGYSEELAKDILRRLDEGETLAAICSGEGMPTRRAVCYWRTSHPEFGAAYDEAVLNGCHALLDETLAIADDSSKDYIQTDKGPILDSEHVQRSKLRIWTRHELIKRKRPDVFSDKVQHSNDPDNPLPAPQFIIQPVVPKE